MKDDLRRLVETEFPKLAVAILEELSHVDKYAPGGHRKKGSSNLFHKERIDPTRCHYVGPVDSGRLGGSDDQVGYEYHTVLQNGRSNSGGKIIFFDVGITDIEDVEAGDLQDLGSKTDTDFVVDEHYHGGSTPIEYEVSTSKTETSEEEQSFSASISAEYTREVEAKAGIGIAEAKVTETLSLKAEASASGEWRKSDSLTEQTRKKYIIPPRTHWQLTSEKSIKHIRQDILVTGLLTCKIHVDSWRWAAHTWDTIGKLKSACRGLDKSGNPWSRFWANQTNGRQTADRVLDAWPIPVLTLNIPLEGKRTRYTKAVTKETPYGT